MEAKERRRSRALDPELEPPRPDLSDEEDEEEEEELDQEVSRFQGLLKDRRRVATTALLFVLLLVAIYVLLPKLVGLGDTLNRIGTATWYWVVVAIVFNAASFLAYTALFRGVLGGVHEDRIRRRLDFGASFQITLSAFAATLLFSAAGAGGLVLTYWALRKAGMSQRRSACRMVAFLTLQYAVYMSALVVFGVLLRTGVLPGAAPFVGTVIPAVLAAAVIALFLLIALIPQDFERRLAGFAQGYRRARHVRRLASVPATVATGVRTAMSYVRHPGDGALALSGAVGYWAANIGVLWASFKAFGVDVPVAVVAQGFFLGMVANLLPSAAGGVGSVDAGLIGAFVLFGIPSDDVFPAVLTFRAVFFWLPVAPGLAAYFRLRRTVAGWESERGEERSDEGYTSKSKVSTLEAT